MPVESDRPVRGRRNPALQVRLLGPLDDQPRRRRARAAGVAQGARAVRLSGACAARGHAQPALRTAVGRPERSARRAALVPEQAQEHRRRARPATGRRAGRHRQARSLGLLRRCDRDRPRDPGAASRRLPPERLRTLSALFAGDFLEGLEIDRSPAFNGWLVAQRRRFRGLPCGPARASRPRAFPTTRRSSIWRSGSQLAPFDRRVHEILLERARAARPHPRGRGAPGGDRPAVRGRRSRLRAASATLWRAARAQAGASPRAQLIAPATAPGVGQRPRRASSRLRRAAPRSR